MWSTKWAIIAQWKDWTRHSPLHDTWNMAAVVCSNKQESTLTELTLCCGSDVMWRKQWREKQKGFSAGSFGGLQKKERAREETRGDWSLFVRHLGRLDLDQRLRVKTSFEDVSPHLTLSALCWVGINPPSFHLIRLEYLCGSNCKSTELKWKPLYTELHFINRLFLKIEERGMVPHFDFSLI